jgi:hypothetical protein
MINNTLGKCSILCSNDRSSVKFDFSNEHGFHILVRKSIRVRKEQNKQMPATDDFFLVIFFDPEDEGEMFYETPCAL